MIRTVIRSFGALDALTLHRLMRLREEVFHVEQHVTLPDADEWDTQALFLWLEAAEEEQPSGPVVGLLRIFAPGVRYAEASVGRVAVHRDYRRQGLCRRMMGEALALIDRQWGCAVRISAQSHLVPFYRTLGFTTTTEEYFEAGLPHRGMVRPQQQAEKKQQAP